MSEVRPEVTGRRAGTSSAKAGVGHSRGPPLLPSLSALELEQHISNTIVGLKAIATNLGLGGTPAVS